MKPEYFIEKKQIRIHLTGKCSWIIELQKNGKVMQSWRFDSDTQCDEFYKSILNNPYRVIEG